MTTETQAIEKSQLQTIVKHKIVLPKIPTSWLIAFVLIGLVILRFMSIDSWTTATLSTIIGVLLTKEYYKSQINNTPSQINNISPQQ